MSAPEPTRDQDEAFALAIAPTINELMGVIRGRLPEGTHFALLIEAQGNGVARVLAGSTNRDRMSLRAAEWALSVSDNPGEPKETLAL